MNAEQARELSHKSIDYVASNQLSDVMSFIRKAANCGQTDCNYFGHMHDSVIKHLQDEGYFVVVYTGSKHISCRGLGADTDWANIRW
jgi:hypothetical protein